MLTISLGIAVWLMSRRNHLDGPIGILLALSICLDAALLVGILAKVLP